MSSVPTLARLGIAGVLALVGCDRSIPPPVENLEPSFVIEPGTVRVSGSSALQPLVNLAKETFEARHRSTSVEVSAGGSRKGLSDVASGAVHVGNSDLFAPADLRDVLVDHRVAVVGFAAVANRGAFNADLRALSLKELAEVFSGKIANWKELGGAPQPIVVVNRAAGSGTRAVFGRVVLDGDRFVESLTEDNSGALVAKLRQTKGAISYVALSFTDADLLTIALRTDAGIVEPTATNITEGAYPLWSYEHMYTRSAPDGPTKAFIDHVLSPEFQNGEVGKIRGFIPITAMKVSQDAD